MTTETKPQAVRGLSVTALVFGALGALFFWWVPMGMVLSLGGLMFAFVDGMMARRRSLDYRLALVGALLCVLALTLDIVIAALGLQRVTFGGQ